MATKSEPRASAKATIVSSVERAETVSETMTTNEAIIFTQRSVSWADMISESFAAAARRTASQASTFTYKFSMPTIAAKVRPAGVPMARWPLAILSTPTPIQPAAMSMLPPIMTFATCSSLPEPYSMSTSTPR